MRVTETRHEALCRRVRGLAFVAVLFFGASAFAQIVGPGNGRMFDPAVYYSLGMGLPVDCEGGAVFGDFNSDGLMDVAFGTVTGQLGVNLASSPSTFNPPTMLPLATTPFPPQGLTLIGAGDFDLDGDVDIAGYDANGYRLLLNGGGGAFTALPPYVPFGAFSAPASAMACFDVDGDGTHELVIGGMGFGGSQIAALGYIPATGLFGLKLTAIVGVTESIWHLGGTDVDGDGAKDVVVVVEDWGGASSVYYLRVYGLVGGAIVLKYSATSTALIGWPFIQGIFVGDMNGDGLGDVLVQYSNTLSTFLGTISGLLTPGPASALGTPLAVAGFAMNTAGMFGQATHRTTVADFDLDGVPDILAPGYTQLGVVRSPAVAPVLKATAWHYIANSYVGSKHSIKAVDLDGDGDLDLIDVAQLSPTYLNTPGITTWMAHYAIYWNRTIYRQPCAPSSGTAPSLLIGTPTPGNANWTLSVSGAQPGALVAFALSKEPAQSTWLGCSLWLNLSPSKLIVPFGGFGFETASSSGDASISMSIPAATGPTLWLYNFPLYACAIAADPLGPLWIGGQWFTSTETRGVLIW